MALKILLAEDEEALSRVYKAALEHQGYEVDQAFNGQEAVDLAAQNAYQVMIIDIMMPIKTGIEALKEIRSSVESTHVIMLTAMAEIDDRVTGLDAGADDYLTKPFILDEVVLRLRAMLRRLAGCANPVLEAGPLEYDVTAARFRLHGQPLTLTAQEHKILAYLMHHPNRVLTRTEISEHVYARDLDPDSNTLDVLIGRIRRKLGQPQLLVTERGQGFRLHSAPPADDRP